MPKQTKEQFARLLGEATAQMKNEIAKREVIPFRLDEQSLKHLQDIAVRKRQHVGALVREWVLERLSQESLEIGKKDAVALPPGQILQLVENTKAQIEVMEKIARENKLYHKKIACLENLQKSSLKEITLLRKCLVNLKLAQHS